MNPIKIKDIEQNKKNFISKTIDNFCYRLGGEEKIFVLDTKTFSFVIIKPSMFNIGYHIFNSLKDFYLFSPNLKPNIYLSNKLRIKPMRCSYKINTINYLQIY